MDLYQQLGIARGASDADIKKAYRSLAKQLHPDRNKDNPKANERFAKVTQAYDILSDKDKRARYDRGEIDEDGNPRMPFGGGFGGGGARSGRPGGGGGAGPGGFDGFPGGSEQGFYAIAIYFIVQNVDGYLIMPYVARKTVDLAPALVLAAQLIFGALFGILGLFLADPIVAAIKTTLQELSAGKKAAGKRPSLPAGAGAEADPGPERPSSAPRRAPAGER